MQQGIEAQLQGAGDNTPGRVTADGRRPYALRLLSQRPASLSDHVLACVSHGGEPAASDDPRHIHVELPVLAGIGVEVWESPVPVRHGRDGQIGYAENGRVLIGQLRLSDAEMAHADRSVFHAYALIDGFLQRHGYPAWLRVWNFIAHINQGEGDDERYRQFSLGRYKALALKPGFEAALPAATAIGTQGAGALVYFLAAREPGLQIENPRQVSAFHYPRQYGPKSPSFSRAMYLPWPDLPELLVSGTASVVGHETLHGGAPLRQLDETLANVRALLARASERGSLDAAGRWQPEVLKLYLRDRAQLPAVQAHLAQALPPDAPLMVLLGDVCRTDLDLEIEGQYQYDRDE